MNCNSVIPVIIPYFKEKEKLKKCISSIEKSTYKNTNIFIRDNSDNNILFTAAINEGIEKFITEKNIEYILILNQDAYLHSNALTHLIETMESEPLCGIACPIQINELKKITWAGGLNSFPFGKHNKPELGSIKNNFETFWANGAAMMLRVKMIREIGMFDKNMKFICSDADYSFTARSRGWKIIVTHDAFVNHSLSSSAGIDNLWLDKIKYEDTIYFSNKWLNGDLYKELSYEGKNLSRIEIRSTLDKLYKELDYITKNLM